MVLLINYYMYCYCCGYYYNYWISKVLSDNLCQDCACIKKGLTVSFTICDHLNSVLIVPSRMDNTMWLELQVSQMGPHSGLT